MFISFGIDDCAIMKHVFIHLSAAIPWAESPGTYATIARDLLTLVTNFKPGMGGLDCFCTFVGRSSGKDPRDSFCRRHIGDGARRWGCS